MAWPGEHCAFAVETFLKTSESVIEILRAFRVHFILSLKDTHLDGKSVVLYVKNSSVTS